MNEGDSIEALQSKIGQLQAMLDVMAQRASSAMFWQLLVETYLDGGLSEEEMRARVLHYRYRHPQSSTRQ